jgi:hypothetical protein
MNVEEESSLLLPININEINKKESNVGRKLIDRKYRSNNKNQETAQQSNKIKVKDSYLEFFLSETNNTKKQYVDENKIREESIMNQNENYIENIDRDCEKR